VLCRNFLNKGTFSRVYLLRKLPIDSIRNYLRNISTLYLIIVPCFSPFSAAKRFARLLTASHLPLHSPYSTAPRAQWSIGRSVMIGHDIICHDLCRSITKVQHRIGQAKSQSANPPVPKFNVQPIKSSPSLFRLDTLTTANDPIDSYRSAGQPAIVRSSSRSKQEVTVRSLVFNCRFSRYCQYYCQ